VACSLCLYTREDCADCDHCECSCCCGQYDDDRCVSCGAEVDHYLGCPDDPNPDYEAESEIR
jgi:hypothetical protein